MPEKFDYFVGTYVGNDGNGWSVDSQLRIAIPSPLRSTLYIREGLNVNNGNAKEDLPDLSLVIGGVFWGDSGVEHLVVADREGYKSSEADWRAKGQTPSAKMYVTKLDAQGRINTATAVELANKVWGYQITQTDHVFFVGSHHFIEIYKMSDFEEFKKNTFQRTPKRHKT